MRAKEGGGGKASARELSLVKLITVRILCIVGSLSGTASSPAGACRGSRLQDSSAFIRPCKSAITALEGFCPLRSGWHQSTCLRKLPLNCLPHRQGSSCSWPMNIFLFMSQVSNEKISHNFSMSFFYGKLILGMLIFDSRYARAPSGSYGQV